MRATAVASTPTFRRNRRHFYASANVVARGIMFPECSCVRACVSPEQTSLARYLGYLLTEFDQTFTSNGIRG